LGFCFSKTASAIAPPAANMVPVRANAHGVRPRTVSLGTTSTMSLENNPL
jgi:hypothetical protein